MAVECEMRRKLRVAELFAGVGGFRLGFERAGGFHTTFSNQWEPPGSAHRQFASRCYVERFGKKGHYNEDIEKVLDRVETGDLELGDFDVLCGGFPCQDYSVAKSVSKATGIRGKKGVLWWQIHRMLSWYRAQDRQIPFVVLENVDRLLKSPTSHRGRDFAVMLASLNDLDYDVEWRVVNAADYGFAQKRKRVFIVATLRNAAEVNGLDRVFRSGILARAFPVAGAQMAEHMDGPHERINGRLEQVSREFGKGVVRMEFMNAGFASRRKVWTYGAEPAFDGPFRTLGSVLVSDDEVAEDYFVTREEISRWEELKGAKNEQRTHRVSGEVYRYIEGRIPFPDPLDRPARTILTAESGRSASRFKHVVKQGRRLRRLVPLELERLNGFPDGWTDIGLSPAQRAFCMGNALVVDLVEAIGKAIRARTSARKAGQVLKGV